MTKVDFYILSAGSQEHTACRLVEKAYQLGHKVYVHAASEEHARHLDQLLWTYREGSFVPHEFYVSNQACESPVLIGSSESPESEAEVLINLAPQVPLFFSRFLRVAEIIDHHDEARQHGRERFKFYRDRGYPLDTHNL